MNGQVECILCLFWNDLSYCHVSRVHNLAVSKILLCISFITQKGINLYYSNNVHSILYIWFAYDDALAHVFNTLNLHACALLTLTKQYTLNKQSQTSWWRDCRLFIFNTTAIKQSHIITACYVIRYHASAVNM